MYQKSYSKPEPWVVLLHPAFEDEVLLMQRELRVELTANLRLLATRGPHVARPHVDTLRGSRHPNMKELRVSILSTSMTD